MKVAASFKRYAVVGALREMGALDGEGAVSGQLVRFGLTERTAYRYASDYARWRWRLYAVRTVRP